jgi:hypothetical protein
MDSAIGLRIGEESHLLSGSGIKPTLLKGSPYSADERPRTQYVKAVLMAISPAAASQMIPLHLAGNTTEEQKRQLYGFLVEAAQEAGSDALEQLDRQSAQSVIDVSKQLRKEVIARIFDVVQCHTTSDRFKDEETGSNRVYPPAYRVRPIEAQVTELRKIFPSLSNCHERLARRPLPDGPEAWFAIPRWQMLAPTYNEAVERILEAIAIKRKFSNRIIGKLGEKFLRQSERSKLAEKILAEQQQGNDILVVAAQVGLLHRGSSARRTRVSLAGNEFGLGAFAFASVLLTHPERLSTGETLMVDCSGDEYSVRGDYEFDRVPLFDYDMAGIEFSIFYEDRARNLWGTPTGFLYKTA